MSDKKLAISDSPQYKQLLQDVLQLIQYGRQRVATEVNSTIVLLYWSIGKLINDEILADKRAEYGDQVINNVSTELTLQFGKGYSRSALFRMVRFAKFYSNHQIVATIDMVTCSSALSTGGRIKARLLFADGMCGTLECSHYARQIVFYVV